MNTKAIAKAAFVAALAVFALVSCNKNRHKPGPEVPDEPVVPEEKVTEGLSVKATYFGDYYGKGFQDYILLFQLGELNEEGQFKTSGVELSLDVLTATGGPTLFPAGIYEITDEKYNSAGIIPSIPEGEGEDTTYGDTYLYTQQDADNFWLEPLESAHLEVSVEGAQYTIKVQIVVKGEEYKYCYKGALPIEDKSKSTEPEEEGPAIMTNLTSFLDAISDAISAIRLSCSASWTRIRSSICPLHIRSLRSPTFSIPTCTHQSCDFWKVS